MINKRFYKSTIPSLVNRVALYEAGTVSAGVFVYPKDNFVSILKPSEREDSLCQWKQVKFEMANGTDWKGLYTYDEFYGGQQTGPKRIRMRWP